MNRRKLLLGTGSVLALSLTGAYGAMRYSLNDADRYLPGPELPPSRVVKDAQTALLVIDPYNDFFSQEGNASLLIDSVALNNGLHDNIKALLDRSREAGLTIAYAPHHRFHEGSHLERDFLSPAQYQQRRTESFPREGFGGQWFAGLEPKEGEIISSEHSCSSGFAETDLDEQLQAAGVTHLICVGCISNTCVEATVRSATDLGYHVTVVSDAIAAFSPREHLLATQTALPLVANRVALTRDVMSELV